MTAYYNEIDPHCAQWLRNLIKAGEIAPGDVDERDVRDVTPGELMGYTQCHFFAGIGGWSRALRLAGWPDDSPVWTGSCPCQGFSAAGRGKGFADERHLWPYWFHLIRVVRPPVVFGEQVASKAALEWLDLVYDDLEGEGYAVGSADLCAAGVGAPHIRQRLWFVADAQMHGRSQREVRYQDGQKRPADSRGEKERLRLSGTPGTPGTSGTHLLANPDPPGCERRPQDAGQETGCGTGKSSDCEVDPLADAPGGGKQGRGIQRPGESNSEVSKPGAEQRLERRGASGGLADPGSGPSPGGPHKPGRETEERIASGRAGEDGHFWSSVVWLPCRDGKWRATEPGLLPLAHGLSPDMGCLRPGEDSPFRVIKDPKTGKSRGQAPWRIGMLKGYGNAIVPEVAAEFILSLKEAP